MPESEWIWRDVPHLRILSDELAEAVKQKLGRGSESFGPKAKDQRKQVHRADLYPKVLVRPICDCCGRPMILGRSVGKYQSFFCFKTSSGIKGCTNRGYTSARIVDEAVLRTVMATLFTDDFIADLTADVNKRLAWIARQPIPSTRKLEQQIANDDRQLKRLTDRLDKVDHTHIDVLITKAEEMGRQLAAKRERLKELQRTGRRPNVKSVKEKDVGVARDDCVGAAADGGRQHDVVIGIGQDYGANFSRVDKAHESGISLEQVRRAHALLSQLGGELLSNQYPVQFIQERQTRNDLHLAGCGRVDQSPWHPAPNEAGYDGVGVKHQPHGAAPHDTP